MKKITKNGWKKAKELLDKIWEEPDRYPDNLIILPIEDSEVSTVFSKKRLELISTLQRQERLKVSELSERLGRKVEAVERDLRVLEDYRIIKIEKRGRASIPVLTGTSIVIPMVSMQPKRLEEIEPPSMSMATLTTIPVDWLPWASDIEKQFTNVVTHSISNYLAPVDKVAEYYRILGDDEQIILNNNYKYTELDVLKPMGGV